MKTKILLIALILLIVGGLAQKNLTITDINFDSINSTINLDYVQWGGTVSEPEYTDSERFLWSYPFVQCLFAYEVVCYNDSTLTHTYDFKWYDKCYEQRGNLASGYYFELTCDNKTHFSFTHKEFTPKGFTQWIRKNFAPERTDFQINVGDKVFKIDLPIREEKEWLYQQKKDIQELKSMINK